MKLKEALLGLYAVYRDMRNEGLKILSNVRPKLKSVSDAEQMQEFLEKKYFYWKDDLLSVAQLAKKYNVSTTKLRKMWDTYAALEKKIMKSKDAFGRIGLKELSVGPYSVSLYDKKAEISIFINQGAVTIGAYPRNDMWSKTFERYAYRLKREIKKVLAMEL